MIDILADLEAKAKRVVIPIPLLSEVDGEAMAIARNEAIRAEVEFRRACSPDRILALVGWAKEVALPIIRTMAGNDPVFSYGQDGAESGMRCCFACGVEISDNGTPFPHDEDCAHLVAQKTLASHLDAGEEKK